MSGFLIQSEVPFSLVTSFVFFCPLGPFVFTCSLTFMRA